MPADISFDLFDFPLTNYEIFDNLDEANNRKKTIESWPEEKIKFLIDFVNPSWEDWKKEISN